MTEHDLFPVDDDAAEHGRTRIQAVIADVRAPLALRERIEADRARSRPPQRRRRLVLGGSLAALVVVAVVVALVGSGAGAPGPPTVAQAARLAGLPASAPAPAVDPAHPALLQRSVEGVSYPSWRGEFRWRASGAREDRLHGRRAVTVFYAGPRGARIGYTIVAGDALAEPAGGRRTHQGTERYTVLRRGGSAFVTWRRDGHTCVLAGPASVPAARLLALASWSGEGSTS